ncbi:substrate-binding domain-containing protein [Streptomyces sp. NPDC058525]|uniref:substrate-binding domain-containing protein n=1 Tax=Streptomyces sp. NPDC058525 TaxID=3346538 RepID=UPI0036497CF1
MALSAEERRIRILRVMGEVGTIRVVDLAERLGIPAVTVRRDVAALADSGRLQRSHGAVSLPDTPVPGQESAAPSGRGRVIGMLVPTIGSYFDDVIDGARAAAAAAGARLSLAVAPYGVGDDRTQVERLLEAPVDGLMLTPTWKPGISAEDNDWLAHLPVSTVLVERRAALGTLGADLDSVASDHRHGVLLALRHLAGLGHTSVLLAARDDTWTAHEIRAGYADGVRLFGLAPQPVIDMHRSNGVFAPPDPDRVADAIADAVGETGVRAVLAHNDTAAIQLPPLLQARGLRVPEDLALISYDDLFAAHATPPLTAVAPPRQAVGATAMELLLRRLAVDSALPAQRIELLPTLKVRASCGASAR